MGKGRIVTTDNFFTSFFSCLRVKKTTRLVGTMNKVRRELPASAKCLQQRYSSKLMKVGLRKTFVLFVLCIFLLSRANLRKINRRQ